ncbi:homoserine kinase [Streptococcus cuniculipharyngis]|uniref:Homoserine kinase n=1 Tax=Streptococcus cuniculipharyngis TaxID=1562651 RepID=A0A5C5SDY0_9STRE|nr:homoserine kinase [Streptococcus cuniculipharyngis]TWS99014.1 homoserine kinase [Streptococcus cuniculipharyngis]
MKISVPATSANLGPGFDSVGLAVSKYLTIDVLGVAPDWQVEHDLGADIPSNEDNLLVQVALKVCPNLLPQRIKMTSDIPLARGLGSSSSVIVAGIELANQLGQLGLSDEDKLTLATEIEGHPDNVAPAIFGNLVVASYHQGQVNHLVADFPTAALLAFVPNYQLKTSDSRQVLPQSMSHAQAVAASSIANVAVAALLAGDLEKAGQAMEADQFHESYRQPLVKEFAQIKELAKRHGAYATYLSGAGPTVMVLVPQGREQALKLALDQLALAGETFLLTVDGEGVRVYD